MSDETKPFRVLWEDGVAASVPALRRGEIVQADGGHTYRGYEPVWFDVVGNMPEWNPRVLYRPKPQPTYRPFTAVEAVEFCPRFVVRGDTDMDAGDACLCAGVRKCGRVLMIRKSNQLHFEQTLSELFERWTTEDDDLPCGVIVEGES